MQEESLGRRGEAAAAAYLERVGMTVVERNWRCRFGELDIVALDETTLVLVEVKTRKSTAKGSPEEAVSETKQRKLLRLAEAYIAHSKISPTEIRFDVIAVQPISEDRALLRHHRAAFSA